jgi:hypothetical protein
MSVPPDAATEMLLTSSANLARGCGGPGHFLRVGFALDGGLGRTTVETHRDIERVGIGGRFGPPIVIDLLLALSLAQRASAAFLPSSLPVENNELSRRLPMHQDAVFAAQTRSSRFSIMMAAPSVQEARTWRLP